MVKPRLIILVRHGQSEGNKNRDIHQTIPDHRVKLTQEGWNQARDAGRRLRNLLRPDDKLHFFTSPYRRTRETTEGILSTLTSDDPEASPFQRPDIKVYEEPRLREQDFGNFQPCSAEMERMWQERADYGHFFYRIPNGESAADAYDRISGFNESLWRQFGEDDFASVCVLVTHGLMSRVFLMKWYHFTVEYFEDLRNINHCEFLIMRKHENGKYALENQLRTWSGLKRERALKDPKDKEKDKDEHEKSKDSSNLQRTKTFVVTRRWGGCPNGCNHHKHYVKREDLDILRQKDHEQGGPGPCQSAALKATTSPITVSPGVMVETRVPIFAASNGTIKKTSETRIEQTQILAGLDRTVENGSLEASRTTTANSSPASESTDELQSRPPYMHIGRDGGGTYSGHNSAAETDTDNSDDDALSLHRVASLNAHVKSINERAPGLVITTTGLSNGETATAPTSLGTTNGVRTPAKFDSVDGDDADSEGPSRNRTNRLGDAPPSEGEGESDLDQAEKEDRSIQGSVY